ncbi:ATP-grasp domain-containing protein [Methanobacterium spitsbergense]|uniref:Carbamoyl-phosphate synthase n=1 Tax=Methanobacterium spitsbergense TaxID=2874285 RepID=A0A8T5V1N8_9EURY|nr:ATP-grasp domain-containing protein [Methanobacterium spitsbergense]MBZ2165595.1 ATP-grasp domain-containing protein [Methanobacterium spitsbergense]
MKILFIGARLFDDVAIYNKKNSITSIITESTTNSPNLELADSHHIVPRGMDGPMEIAIKEDVDGVVPLIGIDGPLVEVAIMKENLETEYGIPVAAAGVHAASICAKKYKTKEFLIKNNINTPKCFKISKNNHEVLNGQNINKIPLVLKQDEGQGGFGINIVSSKEKIEEYFMEYETAMAEKFIEGPEVSIEILRWKGKSVPLVPVYKGETTLEGIHPLKKIKKAPLELDGINNTKNNKQIQDIAVKIADSMGLEGTADIDIIFDPETNENKVIEINARPSGTRYITYAATNVNIMHELINMASGKWDALKLKNRIKDYSGIEIPVGNYPSNKNNYKFREISHETPWLIHGPPNHERITVRGETIGAAVNIAEKLEILEKNSI